MFMRDGRELSRHTRIYSRIARFSSVLLLLGTLLGWILVSPIVLSILEWRKPFFFEKDVVFKKREMLMRYESYHEHGRWSLLNPEGELYCAVSQHYDEEKFVHQVTELGDQRWGFVHGVYQGWEQACI
jgi:hypothetical protein